MCDQCVVRDLCPKIGVTKRKSPVKPSAQRKFVFVEEEVKREVGRQDSITTPLALQEERLMGDFNLKDEDGRVMDEVERGSDLKLQVKQERSQQVNSDWSVRPKRARRSKVEVNYKDATAADLKLQISREQKWNE